MDLLQQPKRAEKGLIHERVGWRKRVNAWRKRSPFSPYWIELMWLWDAVEWLAPHAKGRMLDVGCGERPYEDLFAAHVNGYVGLEYPPVADNLHPEIWDKLEQLHGIVDVWGDGQRLPFRSGVFETVLALEMLEHVAHPDACVAEFARVLQPGGMLLLTVPLFAPLHQWPFDFYRYTPKGIEALLARHDFRVEQVLPRGNFSSTVGAMMSHWLIRTLGASHRQHDGTVLLSRWRAPFVLPLIAMTQLFFKACEKLSTDNGASLGYAVVAKRAQI